VGDHCAGLVSRNGKLAYALAPGTRTLYWRGATSIAVERVALGSGLEVPADVVRRLRQLDLLVRYAVVVAVPEQHVGLLFVDGKLARSLEAGSYAFWNFGRNVVAEVTDLRVQGVEVSGQEMLTRDKVSLRVNLAASYRVVDAVASRTRVAKYAEHLYRELQFGLRKAVASKTLDELLGDKASLDGDIFAWGEPARYDMRYTYPARALERALDGEIDWDELHFTSASVHQLRYARDFWRMLRSATLDLGTE